MTFTLSAISKEITIIFIFSVVGKYVVPKNVPMFYEDDKTVEEVEEEKSTKKKKSMLSKGMIEDLKRQHLDTPDEIHEREGFVRKKQIDEMKERRR